MNNLSKQLKNGEIVNIGYIPKNNNGSSEIGMTTVLKNKDGTITIHNPDHDNDGDTITNTNKIKAILWENIKEPA